MVWFWFALVDCWSEVCSGNCWMCDQPCSGEAGHTGNCRCSYHR